MQRVLITDMGTVMVQKPERKQRDGFAGALQLLAVAVAAIGTTSVCAQTVTVTPSVQTQLTWTDNVGATDKKKSDWIAELAPGIAVSRESGRFNGALSARFRSLAYASESSRNTSYLALQGKGEIEALEELLFFDLAANISRDNTSSFSGRSSGDSLSVDENNETRTWSFGPRVQFRLGDTGQGTVRYLSTWLDAGGTTANNQRQDTLTAQLSDPSAARLFGWGLDYSKSRSEYDSTLRDAVTLETLRATLYTNLSPQFRFRVIGGRESNDYGGSRSESGPIYGVGFDWYPSDRTSVSGTTEERVFGRGYNFDFKHRAQRSTWDLSYVKDVSSSLDTLAGGIYSDPQFLTFYNDPGLISAIPDNAQREAFVRLLLGYPATGGTGAVVSNAYTLSKTWRAAFSLIGVRNTLSLSAQRSDSSRLGSITGLSAQDDFALSNTVKTTSLTVSFTHSLTGTSSLNSALTHSRSQGASGTGLDTKRLTATVGLTTKLSPNTTAGLSYRYQRSDGGTLSGDFTENALTANLGMTF